MTPERIKFFLKCFYEEYINQCYQGYDIESDVKKELSKKMENYDIEGYFVKNLDIYVENCDFMKEYSILYNPLLFSIKKEDNPELFNELQLFLIENIQLFLHTILESAIKAYLANDSNATGIRVFIKAIDNKNSKLIDLIDLAEENMKKNNILPPAMG